MTKYYRPWTAAAAAAALLGVAYASGVLAETIVVGDQVMVRRSDAPAPKRGMSMAEVQKHFGEPRERHPTVGTPPITRWDYDSFAVFFEKDLVIDAVIPGAAAVPTPASTPASTPAAAPIPTSAPAPDNAPLSASSDAPISATPPPAAPAPEPAAASGSASAAVPASHDASPKSADPSLSNIALHP